MEVSLGLRDGLWGLQLLFLAEGACLPGVRVQALSQVSSSRGPLAMALLYFWRVYDVLILRSDPWEGGDLLGKCAVEAAV